MSEAEYTTDQMKEIQEFAELMNSTESLNPDLVPYYTPPQEGGKGLDLWGTLRHPLIYSVPFSSTGLVNKQYEYKLSAVSKALDNENFSSYVFLYERPYRIDAFYEIKSSLTNKQYWELLAEIWMDTENQWQNISEWADLLLSDRPEKEAMMTEADLEVYNSLPSFVVVYRGCRKGFNENGLSWTLDRDKALFFASRLHQNGIVVTKYVEKKNIHAVLTGRGESEVIIAYPPNEG